MCNADEKYSKLYKGSETHIYISNALPDFVRKRFRRLTKNLPLSSDLFISTRCKKQSPLMIGEVF